MEISVLEACIVRLPFSDSAQGFRFIQLRKMLFDRNWNANRFRQRRREDRLGLEISWIIQSFSRRYLCNSVNFSSFSSSSSDSASVFKVRTSNSPMNVTTGGVGFMMGCSPTFLHEETDECARCKLLTAFVIFTRANYSLQVSLYELKRWWFNIKWKPFQSW